LGIFVWSSRKVVAAEELEVLLSVGHDHMRWGLAWAIPIIDHVPRAEHAALEGLLRRRGNCNRAPYRWAKELLRFCSEP